MTETAIKLTPAERQLFADLIGELETNFCSPIDCERPDDQEQLPLTALPRLEGTSLVLSEVPDVNEELRYQIEKVLEPGLEYFPSREEERRQKRLARGFAAKLGAAGVKSQM